MNQVIKFAKQVLSRVQATRNRETDDTVEGQARTFRIWMWSSAAGLTLVVIASVVSMAKQGTGSDSRSADVEVSMLDSLPDGYVIAPIDPINVEALDSIFENHGYADLYRAGDGGSTGTSRGSRIAKGLPLVRAPKNPRRFAVLVSEAQSEVLVELNEPVFVILRKKPPKADTQAKHRGKAPLIREPRGRVELIQEDIPEIPQEIPQTTAGAKS